MDNRDEKDLLMKKKRRREEKSKLARKNALKELNAQGRISTSNIEECASETSSCITSKVSTSSSGDLSSRQCDVDKDINESHSKKAPKEKQSNNEEIISTEKSKTELTGVMSSTSRITTQAKLSSLMSYLDNVEFQSCEDDDVTIEKSHWGSEVENQLEEQSSQVTQAMLKMKLNFEEKKKNVHLLEKELAEQKLSMVEQNKLQEADLQRKLKMQKQQYEATIQRHLTFIDQLIDDKKVLNSKCEGFVKELKTIDDKYQRKIKHLNDSHKVETKKIKQNVVASEKIFREQWIKEKTNKIKELTVKGLEPEIQRLMLKHKAALEQQELSHKSQLTQVKSSMEIELNNWKQTYKVQAQSDQESACKREVEIARQRFERQLEEIELKHHSEKRRFQKEIDRNKEESRKWQIKKENELEVLRMKLKGNSEISVENIKQDFDRKQTELRVECEEEIRRLKRNLQFEKTQWQESFAKNQEAIMQQKEKEIKEMLRIERDKEINLVVRKLEEDMNQQREELQQTAENRIKRVKKKYETELIDSEKSERETQDKYIKLKSTINELTEEIMRQKTVCKSKDIEIDEISKRNEKLATERSNVTDVVRQEFIQQIDSLQNQLTNYRSQLHQANTDWRKEVEDLKENNSQELDKIDERVRQMIATKDETISQIKVKCDAATKRADHLQQMFENQRKRLLGGNGDS